MQPEFQDVPAQVTSLLTCAQHGHGVSLTAVDSTICSSGRLASCTAKADILPAHIALAVPGLTSQLRMHTPAT